MADKTEASREAFEAAMAVILNWTPSFMRENRHGDGGYYDHGLMRFWRFWQAAEARGMERAAAICEVRSHSVISRNTYRGKVNNAASFAGGLLAECATAIRSASRGIAEGGSET